MKKLFTLLTLALLSIGMAWADEVTIGRTLALSSTPTDYTLLSDASATVTKDDGSKVQGGTGKDVYFKSSTKTKINAYCYRSQYNYPATGNAAIAEYHDDAYAGFKVVLADGKKMTISKMAAQVAVSEKFTYKVVLLDANENVLYESSNKAIGRFNESSASNVDVTIAPDGGVGVVGGTFYVRLYYFYASSTSKYIVPLNITATGEISDATSYTISTAVSGDGTVTGAGSFVEGAKATLKANPGASTFDHWTKASNGSWSSTDNPLQVVVSGDETYTAVFAAATTYTITGEVATGQDAYGFITNAGDNVVVEDETINFTATANEGYAFINWQKNGADYSTDASITVTSTADATYTAIFKKLFTVTYNLSTYKGDVNKVLNNFDAVKFNEKYAAVNDKYTIPAYAHRYLYNEGHVLTGWTDGVNTYNTGDEITLTGDITLTPVWAATTASLSDSQAGSVVIWNFRFSEILFNAWQGTGAIGYYTKPQTVNGETIAVPMIVDATSGKVDNSSRAANDNAQVNTGTKFTIPAIAGMKIEIPNASANFSTTTIAGSTAYEGTGTKSISYTYTGTDKTIDIVINEGDQYLKTIKVTYPVTASAISATVGATGWATFVTPVALDFTGISDTKAYIVTGHSGNTVNTTPMTGTVPANTPLLLEGVTTAIPVAASSTTDVSANRLKAGAAIGQEAGKTKYVLADEGGKATFLKVVSDITVPSTKAYLEFNEEILAPTMSLEFGNLTGIQNITTAANQGEGMVFDLQGRKVAQPVKGLYIVNGKKVVIK